MTIDYIGQVLTRAGEPIIDAMTVRAALLYAKEQKAFDDPRFVEQFGTLIANNLKNLTDA